MKAIVYEKYGPPEVLHIDEVATPTPKDDEVLIKVRATTVTAGDMRARSLRMPAGFGFLGRLVFGLFGPRQPILGSELSGDVVAVGKKVRAFQVGDAVIAFGDASMGCHAEYRCMREDGQVVRKPESLGYEEAAAVSFGGTTALHFLRKGQVQPGERVLVNGASGAVGSACVQLARHFGAEVTGVCSAANAELVRSLGAAHVIAHDRDDFAREAAAYDVIIDTVGNAPFARSKAALREGGRLLVIAGSLGDMLMAPWQSLFGTKKVITGVALGSQESLRELAELAASGAFKPLIGRRFRFEQMVEAHRLTDSGHKQGNVVLTLGAQTI
jgi:NADPH:quinone reductase-like Zn-dependent oxidoreductase